MSPKSQVGGLKDKKEEQEPECGVNTNTLVVVQSLSRVQLFTTYNTFLKRVKYSSLILPEKNSL